jgi:hypothetical protein
VTVDVRHQGRTERSGSPPRVNGKVLRVHGPQRPERRESLHPSRPNRLQPSRVAAHGPVPARRTRLQSEYAEIARCGTRPEYLRALEVAEDLGLRLDPRSVRAGLALPG